MDAKSSTLQSHHHIRNKKCRDVGSIKLYAAAIAEAIKMATAVPLKTEELFSADSTEFGRSKRILWRALFWKVFTYFKLKPLTHVQCYPNFKAEFQNKIFTGRGRVCVNLFLTLFPIQQNFAHLFDKNSFEWFGWNNEARKFMHVNHIFNAFNRGALPGTVLKVINVFVDGSFRSKISCVCSNFRKGHRICSKMWIKELFAYRQNSFVLPLGPSFGEIFFNEVVRVSGIFQ